MLYIQKTFLPLFFLLSV